MKSKILFFGLILASFGYSNLWGAKETESIYQMINTLDKKDKNTAQNIVSRINKKIDDLIKTENDATIKTQLNKKTDNAVNLLINKFMQTGKPRFASVFTSLIKALDNCTDTQFDTFLNAKCINLALNYAESPDWSVQPPKVIQYPTKKSRAKFIIEQLILLNKADRIFNKLELGKNDPANTLLIESIKTTQPKYLINILIKEIKKAHLENSTTLVQAILEAKTKIKISDHLYDILNNIITTGIIQTQATAFIINIYLPLQSNTENPESYKGKGDNTIAHLLAKLITGKDTKKDFIDPLKNALVELVKQDPLILTITNNANETPLSIIKTDANLISKIKEVLPPEFNSPGLANLLAQLIVIDPSNVALKSYFEGIRNKTPQLLTSKTGTQASALEIIAKSNNKTLEALTKSIIDKIKDDPIISREATQVITMALAAAPDNKGLREAATYIATTSPELLLPKEGTPSPLKYLAESNEVGANTMLTAIVQAIPSTEVSRKQIAKILLEAKPENLELAETIQATVKKLIAASPEAERAPLTQAVADAIMQNIDDKSPTSPLIGFAQAFVQDPANPENISILKLISENGLAKKFGDGSNKKSIIDVLVAKIAKVEILTLLKEMITKILAKAQSEGKDLSSKENVAGILGMDTLPSTLMPEIQPFIAQAITTKELNGKLTQLKAHLTGLKNKLQNLNTKLKDLKGKLVV